MGTNTQQWRAAIGCFTVPGSRAPCRRKETVHPSTAGFALFLSLLLLASCVEPNPGPVDAELAKLLQDLKSDVNKSEERFISKLSEMDNKLTETQNELKSVKKQVGSLEESNQMLQRQIESLEHRMRRNNLIIHNLPTVLNTANDENPVNTVLSLLQNKAFPCIPTEADIDLCYRIGKGEEPRPLFVSFTSHKYKAELMKNVRRLKGSGIGFNDDLSPAQQAVRRDLLERCEEARKAGLDAKVVRGARLCVEGHYLSHKELESDIWMQECMAHKEASNTAKKARDVTGGEKPTTSSGNLQKQPQPGTPGTKATRQATRLQSLSRSGSM